MKYEKFEEWMIGKKVTHVHAESSGVIVERPAEDDPHITVRVKYDEGGLSGKTLGALLCNLEFSEEKPSEEVPIKTSTTFKIGDKVVFSKSSLESGMIDAKEGDVFTVQVQDNGIVYLKELSGGYHHTHFEYYVEKEKEMKKKFAKVGDKIRIVAAESTGDCYKNGDVLEVVATHASWDGVDTIIDDDLGNFHVYHSEYEIVEDNQEDGFVFTEEHVGMEVWCTVLGKGRIEKFSEADDHPLKVTFEQGSQTYTSEGKMFGFTKCSRSLFFSEPVITAELFPPKKPFVPTLKKGDKVVLADSVADYIAEVVREEENHIYYKTEDGVVTFVNKNSVNVFKLGEEVKFQ